MSAHTIPRSTDARGPRAFTLLELLVVVAIMTIVASLCVPAVVTMMRGYALNASGDSVVNQLVLARQTALEKGHAVEARFFLMPNYNQPFTSGTLAVYRGMQCFLEGDPVVSTTGSASTPTTAVSNALYFSSPVVILNNTSQSTLLGSPLLAADPAQPLGAYRSNYKYIVFRFTPDGRTDLPDTLACVTLVIQQDRINSSTGLPANFQTIQIDPVTGAVRNFHP